MKIVSQPVQLGGETLVVGDIVSEATQQVQRKLATATCGEVVKKGGVDIISRVIQAAIATLPTSESGDKILINASDIKGRLMLSASVMLKLAYQLMVAQQADAMRAMNSVWSSETVAKAIQKVGGTLSMEELSEATDLTMIVLDNAESSGLPGSAHSAVALAKKLLPMEVAAPSDNASYQAIADTLAATGVMLDIQDHVRRVLENPVDGYGLDIPDKRNRAIQIKAEALTATSRSFLSRFAAGYLRQARALCLWLSLPAVQRVIVGSTAERVNRMTTHILEEMKPLLSEHPLGWDFASAGTFDRTTLRLDRLFSQIPEPLRAGSTAVSASVNPSVLIADVAFPIEMAAGHIDGWVNLAAYCVSEAKALSNDLKSSVVPSDPGSLTIRPADISITSNMAGPSAPYADRDVVSGYPVLGTRDEVVRLPSPRTFLSLRGLSDWKLVTHADIVATARDEAHGLALGPVIVSGPGSGSALVPAFAEASPEKRNGDFTSESLISVALRSTPEGFADLLSQIVTSQSLGLRQIADDLRFIGVLSVAESGGGVEETVYPTTGHFYHTRNTGGMKGEHGCFHESLSLGTLGSGETLIFRPFKHLPQTSDLRQFPTSLTTVTHSDRARAGGERVVWLRTDAKDAVPFTDLTVVGWRRVSHPVVDVVLAPTVDPTSTNVYLLCNDEGFLMGARRYNAVLTIMGDDPADAGPTTPPPAGDRPIGDSVSSGGISSPWP